MHTQIETDTVREEECTKARDQQAIAPLPKGGGELSTWKGQKSRPTRTQKPDKMSEKNSEDRTSTTRFRQCKPTEDKTKGEQKKINKGIFKECDI